MNTALSTLCREIDDWHPRGRIIPRGNIPIVGWMRYAHATDSDQYGFFRLGLLTSVGILVQPLHRGDMSRVVRHLISYLKVKEVDICVPAKHHVHFSEHTWDKFVLEWEFIYIDEHRLPELHTNLSLFVSTFFTHEMDETTKLIPLRPR